MLLRLPDHLHYPITLTKVEKRVGDTVTRDDILFLYTYTTKVTEGSRYDEEDKVVDKTFVEQFKSSLEGTVRLWRVWEGDVIGHAIDVCEVEEECDHAVQYLGMCTNCGKDMTTVRDGSNITDADRAPISIAHDTQFLTVSRGEASNYHIDTQRRLLATRKLSLVVDLDQTIIHATVEPTILAWQQDKDNPNHDFVKDIPSFWLLDEMPDGRLGTRKTWYYIKSRPGLKEFLEKMSQIYELHIYTMATRKYAQQIAAIIDPEERYFGDRILSRTESGSMTAKNLERLFPIDTKMVVIIDDRGDVWKWNGNLVKVAPLEFFPNTGDVNAGFLPKLQQLKGSAPSANGGKVFTAAVDGDADSHDEGRTNGVIDGTASIQNGTSTLDQLVEMSGGDDPLVREMQLKEQEKIINAQIEEKPMLKMQMEQDEKDADAEKMDDPSALADAGTDGETQQTSATESDSSQSSASTSIPSPPKPRARHAILKDDDRELEILTTRLESVHREFFNEYDRKRLSNKGGRVAALSGKRKAPLDDETAATADLDLIPDVKKVLPAMYKNTLAGVTILFSGVFPLGADVLNADLSTWARTYGAKVTDRLGKHVTHVVARKAGTTKCHQAERMGIHVVATPWLIDSLQAWKRMDEQLYSLSESRRHVSGGDGLDEKMNVTPRDFLLSSSDDDDDSGVESEGDDEPARKRLKVDTRAQQDEQADPDDMDDLDDQSPLTINQDEWDDIDDELKEFLGSEAESESDNDSVSSKISMRGKRKRKRESKESGAEESDAEPNSRKASTANRVSGLRAVANAASEKGSSAEDTPRGAGDGDEGGGDAGDGGDEDALMRRQQRSVETREAMEQAEEEDSDDELARELERELEGSDDGDDEGFMGPAAR